MRSQLLHNIWKVYVEISPIQIQINSVAYWSHVVHTLFTFDWICGFI